MMNSNSTCFPGNSSSSACLTPSPSGSSAGLIAGLSVFFVLVVLFIVAGVLAYRKFGQLRRVLSFGSRKRIQKEREDEVQGEAPKTVRESHDYTTRPERTPEQAPEQAPIYENVTRTAGYRDSRSAPAPDNDVYLQCDAIYSNDPNCSPSAHHQEDDTYIIPDS